jgi:Amt family ammonium transporter
MAQDRRGRRAATDGRRAAAPRRRRPPAAAAAAATAPPPAAPPAPVPNKGDVAWMLVATLLVIMMTVPGLALFYGGLVRSKNMLSVLMQVFVTFSLIVVLWCVYGYSLAFTEGNAFIGGFDRLFLKGIFDPATGSSRWRHLQQGRGHPRDRVRRLPGHVRRHHLLPDRRRLRRAHQVLAVLLFMVLWFTFSYLPIAHMVWFWMGPDAYTARSVVDAMNAKAGLIWQWGALDFAGGTVVHINAAVAGLVGAYMIGKRIGYGREAMAPHSLPLTMIGASLLWVGWFGFNAGSALEAGNSAALAFINTFSPPRRGAGLVRGRGAAAGKASMLGAASGAVAGLVAITPAAGNVGIVGARFVIGFVAGFACLWGVNGLKRLLGADDSLDVFGVHGVGGIVGALLTGVFNTRRWAARAGGRLGHRDGRLQRHRRQVWIQAKAVGLTIVWSAWSLVAYKIVDLTIGLRVRGRRARRPGHQRRTARRPTTSRRCGTAGLCEEGAACGRSPLFSWRLHCLRPAAPRLPQNRAPVEHLECPWSRTSSPPSPAPSTSWSSASSSRCRPSSAGSGSSGWSTRRRSTRGRPAQRRLQAGAGGHQPVPGRLHNLTPRDAAAGGAGGDGGDREDLPRGQEPAADPRRRHAQHLLPEHLQRLVQIFTQAGLNVRLGSLDAG